MLTSRRGAGPKRRPRTIRVTHETEHKPEREHDERRRDAAAAAGVEAAAMVAGDVLVLVVAGAGSFFWGGPALITRHAKCIKNKWITQEILS